MSEKKKTPGVGSRLDLAWYHQICGDLSNWRIDEFIRALGGGEGAILGFVRGLHFSAQLIYALRDILGGQTGLKVDWGHLLDKSEAYCSRECDIIIHRGERNCWNGGHANPIMDFKFVCQKAAVGVISCKSYLRSGQVDRRYAADLRPFVDKVWLFAECCEAGQAKVLRKQAKSAGYDKFWYMYEWSRSESGYRQNEKEWLDFVDAVRKLKPRGQAGR